MAALASHLHTIHLPTVGLAVASLVILLGWNRLATRFPALKRAPGPLAVLVIGTAANALLNLPVETIGSRFGGIPQEIPPFSFPALDPTTLGKLMAPALTIALLGAIESLLRRASPTARSRIATTPTRSCSRKAWRTSSRPCSAASPPPARLPVPPPTSAPVAARRWPASCMRWCCWRWCWCSRRWLGYPARHTVGHRGRGFDQHGRMARLLAQGTGALLQPVPHHPARHLLRHRAVRSDAGGGAGHGAGEPVLHLPDVRPHPHGTHPARRPLRRRGTEQGRRYAAHRRLPDVRQPVLRRRQQAREHAAETRRQSRDADPRHGQGHQHGYHRPRYPADPASRPQEDRHAADSLRPELAARLADLPFGLPRPARRG